jgi:phosphoribosylglycinamide formyltransferase-1
MPTSFVSETIEPLDASFDAAGMSRGEPGVPLKFRWRKAEWTVAAVLDSGREHGDCSHGSGERYVRRHVYRVRMTCGVILQLCFQRNFGRGPFRRHSRWWIRRMETPATPVLLTESNCPAPTAAATIPAPRSRPALNAAA